MESRILYRKKKRGQPVRVFLNSKLWRSAWPLAREVDQPPVAVPQLVDPGISRDSSSLGAEAELKVLKVNRSIGKKVRAKVKNFEQSYFFKGFTVY